MNVNFLSDLLTKIEIFFIKNQILLPIIISSFLLKFLFLLFLIYHWYKKTVLINALYFWITVLLLTAIIPDTAWLLKLYSLRFPHFFAYATVISYIRISWIAFIIQYQLIGIIMNNVIKKKVNLKKFFLINTPNFIFIVILLIIFLIDKDCLNEQKRFWLEDSIQKIIVIYLTLFFIPYTIWEFYKDAKKTILIIQKQFKIFIFFWIIPQVFADFIHLNPFSLDWPITQSYTFVAISTMLLNCMIYFCARNIIRLRFLNFKKHLDHVTLGYEFEEVFQKSLIELGAISNLDDLGKHIQIFFERLLAIPQNCITSHIQVNNHNNDIPNNSDGVCQTLKIFHQQLKQDPDTIIINFLAENKIAIRHELEFNTFYTENLNDQKLLDLLTVLKTDLIIPIFYKDSILGYISIRDDQNQHYTLLTKAQQKASIIFASYLGTFVQILQNNRLEQIQTKAYQIENQIFEFTQQIYYYQEGIAKILKEINTPLGLFIYQKNNLIPLYKNIFIYHIKQDAFHKQIISMIRHTIDNQLEQYESIVSTHENDFVCKILMLPYKNQLLIILNTKTGLEKIESLTNYNNSNLFSPFAFYLYCTKKGQSIQQFLPGSSEAITKFKIKIMQSALNKKPIMLYAEKNDLKNISLLLHTLTERSNYAYFNAKESTPSEHAELIFGVQTLYTENQMHHGLLDHCNNGTLTIENLAWMSHGIQNDLTHFLLSGEYLPLKGFHSRKSNVRIIFITAYDEMKKPAPYTIFSNLQEIFSDQVIYFPQLELLSENEYVEFIKTMLQAYLSETVSLEKEEALIHSFLIKKSQSLSELQKEIQERINHFQENSYQKKFTFNDEITLDHIIQKGKHVLKNPDELSLLWNKFNKNQSHIASLLKVNRSSVNRRIKEYNL